MERFLERHRDRIVGTIAGFDRVLFRGLLISICHVDGFGRFLSSQRVLYKDFREFAEMFTKGIEARVRELVSEAGQSVRYLNNASMKKDELVRKIMSKEQKKEGLICVLSCVEPCQSFAIRGNRAEKRLNLISEQRKCLHYYFYYVDREFGVMHIRLQSWFPFTIQVCVNGREWLARQMDKAGISYTKVDNCFTEIGDLEKAQELADSFKKLRLEGMLSAFARRVNPWLDKKGKVVLRPYYWTMRQAEYATDVMFVDENALNELYPKLLHHAIEQFSCEDVLRFLGRKSDARFAGEVKSSLGRRVEGSRVKHWVEENSIKMYNKAESVLRVETTINNPRRFRTRRRMNKDGKIVIRYLPMRKGIADISRRVEISRVANSRYLEALSVIGVPTPSRKLFDSVSRRVEVNGRKYRPLRPVNPDDSALFRIVLRGENSVQGVRNKDIRDQLYPDAMVDDQKRHKASARVSRSLRLLRAHNLIYKVARTNYYRVTKKGYEVMSTSTKFRESEIALLAA